MNKSRDLLLKPNLINLKSFSDPRGELSVISSLKDFFNVNINRLYILHNSKPNVERGGHAHPNLWQLLICATGRVTIEVKTPYEKFECELEDCNKALIIPPGYWRSLKNFTAETVIFVLADKEYEETVYIKDFVAYHEWFDANSTTN